MKKITMATTLLLASLGCFSNAFATIHVDGKSTNLINSDPSQPFEGKVTYVSYFRQNNEPAIAIEVIDENHSSVQITFKDVDLPTGMAFVSTLGKPLVVEFADTNFTISGFFTYEESLNAKSAIAKLHNKFQTK